MVLFTHATLPLLVTLSKHPDVVNADGVFDAYNCCASANAAALALKEAQLSPRDRAMRRVS